MLLPRESPNKSHSFLRRGSLFTELVTDALAERTYDADLAGMSHHFGAKIHGLTISVAGYSEKIPVLLDSILKEMTTFVVNSERFAVQKEQVRASLLFVEGLSSFESCR